MRKTKTFSIFFVLFVFIAASAAILACGGKKEGLPLLFYKEEGGVFYPYQREWIYDQGSISTTDEALKITMLPLNYQPDLLYEKQWFTSASSPRTGRDVFIRNGDSRHDLHVQTTDEQFADITLVRPDELSEAEWDNTRLLKADYDKKAKKLSLVLVANSFSDQKEPLLLIGETSLPSSGKITWKQINVKADEYFHLQYEDYLVLADEWLYGTSADLPIRISLKTGQTEKLDQLQASVTSLLPDEAPEEEGDMIKRLYPVGRCEDMVIWEWPGSTGYKGIYFLSDEQNLISSITVRADGMWDIRDSRGNNSTVDMSGVYQNVLYFPQ